MPNFRCGAVNIHYEESGPADGFPILLIAPGGMKSAIAFWANAPWNPIEHLSGEFRVIAMDQRNAGQSTAPVTAQDSWASYAADQLGLMAHLGAQRFLVAAGLGFDRRLVLAAQPPGSVGLGLGIRLQPRQVRRRRELDLCEHSRLRQRIAAPSRPAGADVRGRAVLVQLGAGPTVRRRLGGVRVGADLVSHRLSLALPRLWPLAHALGEPAAGRRRQPREPWHRRDGKLPRLGPVRQAIRRHSRHVRGRRRHALADRPGPVRNAVGGTAGDAIRGAGAGQRRSGGEVGSRQPNARHQPLPGTDRTALGPGSDPLAGVRHHAFRT